MDNIVGCLFDIPVYLDSNYQFYLERLGERYIASSFSQLKLIVDEIARKEKIKSLNFQQIIVLEIQDFLDDPFDVFSRSIACFNSHFVYKNKRNDGTESIQQYSGPTETNIRERTFVFSYSNQTKEDIFLLKKFISSFQKELCEALTSETKLHEYIKNLKIFSIDKSNIFEETK